MRICVIVITVLMVAVTAFKAAQDRDPVIFAWLSGFHLLVGAVAYMVTGWVERRLKFPSRWLWKVRLAVLIWLGVFLALGVPTLVLWLSLK